MNRRALVTGITGQDGSYLADLLLEKDYEVHGIVRPGEGKGARSASNLAAALEKGRDRVRLHLGDLCDATGLEEIVASVRPDEVYHLGAQSDPVRSFDDPQYTAEVTGVGTLRLLEAIRKTGVDCRFFQANTRALFGKATESTQNETTPFRPDSPYAAAKAYAFYVTRTYREAYGMFAVNGILFDHISERRDHACPARRITRAVGRIIAGLQDLLLVDDLEDARDFGHAKDTVRAMWMMLQAEQPEDYVIGTGRSRTMRDLCETAFADVGLDWRPYVRSCKPLPDAEDAHPSCADATKIRQMLGWSPAIGFEETVGRMVSHDLALAEGDLEAMEQAAARRTRPPARASLG